MKCCALLDRLDRADLLVHFHEVEVVPGFNDLTVFDTNYSHSSKLHRRVTSGNPEMIASVLATNGTTGGNHVSFSDHVFRHNLDVRKCAAKDFMKRFEA